MEFSRDKKLAVTGSADATVRCWDLEEKKQIAVLVGHKELISCLCISESQRIIASGSLDKTVRVWDAKNYTQIFDIGCKGWVRFLKVGWNDDVVIFNCFNENTINVYNLIERSRGRVITLIMSRRVLEISISKSNKYVVVMTSQANAYSIQVFKL